MAVKAAPAAVVTFPLPRVELSESNRFRFPPLLLVMLALIVMLLSASKIRALLLDQLIARWKP